MLTAILMNSIQFLPRFGEFTLTVSKENMTLNCKVNDSTERAPVENFKNALEGNGFNDLHRYKDQTMGMLLAKRIAQEFGGDIKYPREEYVHSCLLYIQLHQVDLGQSCIEDE